MPSEHKTTLRCFPAARHGSTAHLHKDRSTVGANSGASRTGQTLPCTAKIGAAPRGDAGGGRAVLGLQHPAAGEGAAGFAGGAAAALKAAAAAPEAAAAVAGCRSHGAERCWRHRVPSLLEGGPADMAAHGEGAGTGQRRPGEEEEREGGEKQQGEEAQRAVRQQKGAREGMGARGAFVRGRAGALGPSSLSSSSA